MSGIIIPGEVGSQFEPRLTVDGLRNLIQDLRAARQRIPSYIVVSEYDRRDLNQDLCSGAKEVDAGAERPEHDGCAIGVVEGVLIRSHPDVPRAKARFVYSAEKREIDSRLGGEGLIIVGA